MVLNTEFNQGIRISIGGESVTVQATSERGRMRYWVGKPDSVSVEPVQCRTSSKAPIGARQPAVCRMSRPPNAER